MKLLLAPEVTALKALDGNGGVATIAAKPSPTSVDNAPGNLRP